MAGAGDQTEASLMSVAVAVWYEVLIQRRFQRRDRAAGGLLPFGAERASCE
jgi:hypothetical protein